MNKQINTVPFYNSNIPCNWDVKKLGSLGGFSKGKGILKEQVVEKGFPCIRYGEIYTTHNFILKEFKSFINEEVAKESNEIKNGDILFAGSGETIEEIGKAVAYIGNEKAYAGGDVIILSTNENVKAEFISYALETDFTKKQKRRLGQGNSVVHIYPSDLAEVKIILPPLPEQKAIAHVLGLMDNAINKNNLLIEKKELQKKWLMQMLLTGKKRVRGFEKTKWEEKRMKDVCDKFLNGGTPSTQNKNYWAGNIPWITGADVVDQTIAEVRRFITPQAVIESSTNVIPRGNLLLVTRTGVGKVAIAPFDVAISQDLTGLLLNTRVIDTAFAFYFLGKSGNILTRLNQGTSIIGITRDVLEAIKVPCPSKEEQNSIVSVIQAADKEIQLLKSKTEKLREEKKGLMQVLLTGKKRLKYDTQNI